MVPIAVAFAVVAMRQQYSSHKIKSKQPECVHEHEHAFIILSQYKQSLNKDAGACRGWLLLR
jgi:hypothetical protein